MDRTVLITGANKGIGFETARQLASKGFRVIISGRDAGRLDKALALLHEDGLKADTLVMDVGDPDGIRKAAAGCSKTGFRLDVLINNAGILIKEDRNLAEDDAKILEATVRTNAYGPLHVIRAFLPLMNKPGRIINISSGGGSMSGPVAGWSPAYCISKTMLNAITRHLSLQLADSGVSVNAVNPGWVRTDMGGSGAARSVAKGAETPVWLADDAPSRLSGEFFRDKRDIPW